MALQASFFKKTLLFNFRARTSRGAMSQKDSWFIKIREENEADVFGIGEAGPLPGLSIEWDEAFEIKVAKAVVEFNHLRLSLNSFSENFQDNSQLLLQQLPGLDRSPSLLYAFETAILDLLHEGHRIIFNTPFTKGTPIPINGLIWMGGMDQMLQQIEIKIQEGFNCLKMKVGGIDFERECDILQYIRRKYFKMDIMLRLDANGAFKQDEVRYKLHEFSRFTIHSIEQPLKAGNPLMKDLMKDSPIPVALDEELIGVHELDRKKELLERIRPAFIILKPSLHGGLSGCDQWIKIAEKMNIGWWMTSALESNIGLNAVAQFVSKYDNTLHQGLGTGQIYSNNFESPLQVSKGHLRFDNSLNWTLTENN